jgi:hypothetical protein
MRVFRGFRKRLGDRSGVRGVAALVAASAVTLVLLGAGSTVAGTPVLTPEGFEGTTPWTTTGFWHVQDHPEGIAVKSPDINPNLVTLPDSGQLPSAIEGTHVAWFGEASTGTFCGPDFASVSQASKNGCTSNGAKSGFLTSPPFDLTNATSAQAAFDAWWEIEAVNADSFDIMEVDYSTDGGQTWTSAGKLNPPNNPAGAHDQSYSANGLEVSPSWHHYVVDLTPAATHANVQVRFNFDTRDTLYQGFRGWLVDNVVVSTPYEVGAPTISSLSPSCVVNTQSQAVGVNGANFPLGTKVLLDGSEVANAASVSSTRLEFITQGLAAGPHTVQAKAPNGATSNSVTLTSEAETCAPKQILTIDFSGPGSVLVNGAPCGTAPKCTLSLPKGSSVKLEAKPEGNANFRGFGGACEGFDPCTFVLDADKTVSASFSLDPVIGDAPEPAQLPPPSNPLSINLSGNGSVKTVKAAAFRSPSASFAGAAGPPAVNCSPSAYACYGTADPSSSVTLKATPAQGSTFQGWSGAPECGSAPACTVAMNRAQTVTAKFGPKKRIPVKVLLKAPLFRIGWNASTGRGSMVVTGRVSRSAKLLLDLRRPGHGGPLLRRPFRASGSFRHREKLPSRLFPKGARLLPGGFVVFIVGKAGTFRLPIQLRTAVVPSPVEGVVRISFASATRNGRVARRLPRGTREAWANFRFAAQPRSLDLVAAWYMPGGKLLGTIKKSNRPVVSTFIRSAAPLPAGAWRVDLFAGNRLVKRQFVRIG